MTNQGKMSTKKNVTTPYREHTFLVQRKTTLIAEVLTPDLFKTPNLLVAGRCVLLVHRNVKKQIMILVHYEQTDANYCF